jgi:glyoxylase-like metal-dependent hydrolase (beta-lactamase superfamily II)
MNPILLGIKQEWPGLDDFIGAWVCRDGVNIVVDVGPANSVNHLIGSLEEMNLDRVDFVLLSHIHIDHAGGLADFLDRYPMSKAVCHAKGLKHLINPSRLWAGSSKVLGNLAESYGPVKPVPPEKLIPHTEARVKGVRIIETPGHAPHHLSFAHGAQLFVGEAGGNYLFRQEHEYVRPATPPRFFMEEFLNSVERLMALEDQPICYAHFGRAGSSRNMLERFRNQLMRWKEIIEDEMSGTREGLEGRCIQRLLNVDPDLAAFRLMSSEQQEMERYFIGNSVRGYIGFLEENT